LYLLLAIFKAINEAIITAGFKKNNSGIGKNT
jgi:hypothetical protein